MTNQNKIQWVYSSKDNQELEERYDQWAKDYNNDLAVEFLYLAPQRAARVFASHVPRHAHVLDAGAGTGLVGEALSEMGYHQMSAMDMSRGMLEEARKKDIYRDLCQMVMGEPLDYPTDSFDAVISVGVFTVGHAPASSFNELIRITKPGGHIAFSLRPDVYENNGFRDKQTSLELEDNWRLVEVSTEFQPMPKGEPDIYHQVWVYQVTPE
jgi:predicted TPR repeat methyltransferase